MRHAVVALHVLLLEDVLALVLALRRRDVDVELHQQDPFISETALVASSVEPTSREAEALGVALVVGHGLGW